MIGRGGEWRGQLSLAIASNGIQSYLIGCARFASIVRFARFEQIWLLLSLLLQRSVFFLLMAPKYNIFFIVVFVFLIKFNIITVFAAVGLVFSSQIFRFAFSFDRSFDLICHWVRLFRFGSIPKLGHTIFSFLFFSATLIQFLDMIVYLFGRWPFTNFIFSFFMKKQNDHRNAG